MIKNPNISIYLDVSSDCTDEKAETGLECKNGDVKLNKDGTPFIFWDNLWSPLCGHYFWDNQYGAVKFCQKLGYALGIHSGKPINRTYPVDSFSIGACLESDEWPSCTGGENYFTPGKAFTNGTCEKSNNEAIMITCIGDKKYVNNPSCKGNEIGICTYLNPMKFKTRIWECYTTTKLQ